MQGHFLVSYFRVFDVVLCGLPGASYSINGYLPLAFTPFLSHLLTHPLTHLLTHPLTHPPSYPPSYRLTLFLSSSHLSL